ncbi:hypothetical protein Q604_UNBC07123G0001, partial [human gut metagenome]
MLLKPFIPQRKRRKNNESSIV